MQIRLWDLCCVELSSSKNDKVPNDYEVLGMGAAREDRCSCLSRDSLIHAIADFWLISFTYPYDTFCHFFFSIPALPLFLSSTTTDLC